MSDRFKNSRTMVWFCLWSILAITGAVVALKLEGAGSVAGSAVMTMGGLAAAWSGITNFTQMKGEKKDEL